MRPDAPNFIILLCLLTDYFTLSSARQFYSSWGECCHSMRYQTICPCTLLTLKWQYVLLYYFTLSNARRFCSSGGANGLTYKKYVIKHVYNYQEVLQYSTLTFSQNCMQDYHEDCCFFSFNVNLNCFLFKMDRR